MASVSGKPASCSGMPVSPLAIWCRPVWNSPRAGNLRAPLFFSHPARLRAARESAGCPHLGALTGTLSRWPPRCFLCPRCPVARPLRSLPRLSPPAAAGLPTGTWERVFSSRSLDSSSWFPPVRCQIFCVFVHMSRVDNSLLVKLK
jgi:hypothetical protein